MSECPGCGDSAFKAYLSDDYAKVTEQEAHILWRCVYCGYTEIKHYRAEEWELKDTNNKLAVRVAALGAEAGRFEMEKEHAEEQLEELWIATKGIRPDTGEGWLTPRMERDAYRLRDKLNSETNDE